MIDCHLHCNYSRDCLHSVGEMAAAAAARGLELICFTTHFEPDRLDDRGGSIMLEKIRAYQREIAAASEEHDIKALFGIEIAYEYGKEKMIGQLTGEHAFDYVLGSVHCVDGISVSDRSEASRIFSMMPREEVIDAYFRKLSALVESGMFDAVAHFDVVAKYMGVPRDKSLPLYSRYVPSIVAEMRGNGVAFEYNSGGTRLTGKPFPHPQLLKAFAGMPVVFGSDSHAPEQVGGHWDESMALLRGAGFTELSYFEQRQRKTIRV